MEGLAPPGVALEVRERGAALLLSGAKTVEARAYPLPDDLIGAPILLVATPDAAAAPLADEIEPGTSCGGAGAAVAVVAFSGCKLYGSEGEWLTDEGLHRVPPGSPLRWSPGARAPAAAAAA